MDPQGKVNAERLHQSIARRLGTAILNGRHQPGDPIEGEVEQSAALGVSRTAYREAVRIVTAKGMLESRPKAGTRVTARSRWNMLDPEVLSWMFQSEPDEGFIADLFELRGVLEPAAAEMAARRRSEGQLAEMATHLDCMHEQGLFQPEGQEADRQFHRAILEATGNEAMISLGSSIGAAVQWTTRFKQRANMLPRDPYDDHRAVYDAIAAADPVAAGDAMRRLLRLALADMQPGAAAR